MSVKIKKLTENAIVPARVAGGQAIYDLVCSAITTEINERGELILVYHTGVAIEIPTGYVGIVSMLGSGSAKTISMSTGVDVIRPDYKDEVVGKFRSTVSVVPAVYKEGDKFAQLIIVPTAEVEFEEIEEVVNPTNESSAATETQSPSEGEGMPTNSEPAPEQAAGENAPEQA